MNETKTSNRGPPAMVIGLNGIGTSLALLLTRLGSHSLTLIDDRSVNPATRRSEGFDDDDQGRPRIHAVAEQCHRLQPRLKILTSPDLPYPQFENPFLFIGDLRQLSAAQLPQDGALRIAYWLPDQDVILIVARDISVRDWSTFVPVNVEWLDCSDHITGDPVVATLIASLMVGLALSLPCGKSARALRLDPRSMTVTATPVP